MSTAAPHICYCILSTSAGMNICSVKIQPISSCSLLAYFNTAFTAFYFHQGVTRCQTLYSQTLRILSLCLFILDLMGGRVKKAIQKAEKNRQQVLADMGMKGTGSTHTLCFLLLCCSVTCKMNFSHLSSKLSKTSCQCISELVCVWPRRT